jgi:sirohydrochlorin ferrochelatase
VNRVAVLLAHGSPDPRSADVVRAAAAEVAGIHGLPVIAAFLDHCSPNLTQAVPPDATSVVVLPLLLSSAFHARVDVPAAASALLAACPSLALDVLAPVGHPPEVLDDLLTRAAAPTVVVAAGTNLDSERAAFAELVAGASRRTGVAARAAFATGSGPSMTDAMDEDCVIVPWLLAPGRIFDVVAENARGHRVLGTGLLTEPTMIDAIARLLAVALVP